MTFDNIFLQYVTAKSALPITGGALNLEHLSQSWRRGCAWVVCFPCGEVFPLFSSFSGMH